MHTAEDGAPRRPLDVLIVTQPVDGGVATCVRHLVQAAVAAGHRTTLVSPARAGEPFATSASAWGANHVTLLNHDRGPRVRDLRAVLALRSLMRGRDVVHLHSSKAGAVGRIAAVLMVRKRPKVVFTPHAWSWLVGGPVARAYRLVERILGHVSDVIVAVSESEARDGRAVLGRARNRIVVIENGVDLTRFAPSRPSADRDRTAPLIVCVGRLTRQKGQDVALRALSLMENQEARIRFVGSGQDAGLLSELARRLGIDDRVEWTGAVSDTAPHLCAADVALAPSRWEGSSLVMLEAMACGAPLVVTRVNGAEAVGEAGIIVPPDDPAAIAEALDRLLADEPLRRELGKRALERSANHDVRRMTVRNLALWDRLTAEGTRGGTPT